MKRLAPYVHRLTLALSALSLNAHGLLAMQELPPAPAPENVTVPIPDPGPPIPVPSSHSDALALAPTTTDEEVLLRGPVHEAFAEQFNQDPIEGVVIPGKPPELIEEVPPELRPDGRQIEWIPGYWSWDDEENDFLWVSGIWREVPQGFRWLPGYWSETANGYQWISGTWVSAQTEEIQYIETAPPQSLELGPVGTAPSVDHFWIPGCWNWNASRYAWRPGYWSVGQVNWIWVPARYVCSPRGYIYSDGYWDYPLQRRGMLFAPCRFRGMSQWHQRYRFTPRVIVAANLLPLHFWVRPNFRHYYFGDFYGNGYASRGFQPWHRFHHHRRQFDPLFAHCSRTHSGGRFNYYDQANSRFDLLSSHPDRRPFRGFDGHNHRLASDGIDNDLRPTQLGRTIQEHVKESGSAHFVKLENGVRQRLQDDSREIHTLVERRRDVERPTGELSGSDKGRNRDQAQSEPERDRRGTVEKDPIRNPGVDDEKNQPGDSNGGKVPDSQPVVRRDRLKLPPSTRSDDASEKIRAKVDATPDRTSKDQSPGTPVTRGERPHGVDEALNRARQSARNAKDTGKDESSVVRKRADNSPGQPLTQKSPGNMNQKSDRLKEGAAETQRGGTAIRKELTGRVQPELAERKAPNDGAVSQRIQSQTKGQADNSLRTRGSAETGQRGNVVPREGRVRSGQTNIPSQESNNRGSVRSGGVTGRSDVGSARVSPSQNPERSVRPPAAERPSRGAVERQSEVRRDVRVDAPRSNGAAERSRAADTPRSSPEPRERSSPNSEGSGRRKK